MVRSKAIVSGLLLIGIGLMGYSLLHGAVSLSIAQAYDALTQAEPNVNYTILWQLRVPRVLAAFAAGGLLALSGALLQVLLQNPLADPYVLGVSSGSTVLLLLATSLGWTQAWMLSGASLSGAGMALYLLLMLTRTRRVPSILLLTGVVLASAFATVSTLILLMSDAQDAQAMLYWLVGDLSLPRLPWISFSVLVIVTSLAYRLSPQLDLLRYGMKEATILGVSVNRLQWQILLLTTVATAFAVNLAGPVGFVGLIVPHSLRLLHHSGHHYLLISSVLLGGLLVVAADCLARTLFSPIQLPVGLVTASLGIPVFLYLLMRQQTCYN